MARSELRRLDDAESGLSFYFAYHRDQPDRLHVEVRGLNPERAIVTYLEARLTIRDDEHTCWVSYTKTHGIRWNLYNDQQGHIIIILCFELEED